MIHHKLRWFGGLIVLLAVLVPRASWANNAAPQSRVQEVLASAVQVAVGGEHTCAIIKNGDVMCWGANDKGQLGNNSSIYSAIPTRVVNLNNKMIAIAAGDYHTCGITDIGSVKCWGGGIGGALGNDSYANSFSPVNVINLNQDAMKISSGGSTNCVILRNNIAKCWGDNGYGQLGSSSVVNGSSIPLNIDVISEGIIDISTGGSHTCAITISSSAKCWGSNVSGELGNGTTITSKTPVNVIGLESGVKQITATAHQHTCALLQSGKVKCWGVNTFGQLGNPAIGRTIQSSPIAVNLSDSATQIAIGTDYSCAILIQGSLMCWGNNFRGEIGNNAPAATYMY